MLIKKGNYSKIDDLGPGKGNLAPATGKKPNAGDSVYRGPESGEAEKVKAKKILADKPSKIIKESPKPNWGDLTSKALSRNSGSLSDAAKRILRDLKSKEPSVDWKKELKKFFDSTFKSDEWILPNKRFLAGGDTLYGRKTIGDDTLKTIVAAVDTSSSISKSQIKIFVNEIMYLCKTFDAQETIIIYCSDHIDNIDRIKKGGQPDFTKIASTGGNDEGFIPPFEWVEQNKIKPSLFVYLTDTGGEMPDPNKYGIKKYMKRVFWFICSDQVYNPPPFGKILFAPTTAIKDKY